MTAKAEELVVEGPGVMLARRWPAGSWFATRILIVAFAELDAILLEVPSDGVFFDRLFEPPSDGLPLLFDTSGSGAACKAGCWQIKFKYNINETQPDYSPYSEFRERCARGIYEHEICIPYPA